MGSKRWRKTISWAALAAVLAALAVPIAAAAEPAPVAREHLLTLADYESVYPDMRRPAPHRAALAGLRPARLRRPGAGGARQQPDPRQRLPPCDAVRSSLIDQNLVRFSSKAQARALVQRYRHFSKHCVGNVATDDGEGGDVTPQEPGVAAAARG